jgi:hypothetical protein
MYHFDISRPQYISAQKILTLFDALDEREIARQFSDARAFMKLKNKLLLLHTGSGFQWYRTYERGYKTSGSPLHFMLRRSSLIECVSVARLNETRFGPKNKSSPIYLGPKNLDTF